MVGSLQQTPNSSVWNSIEEPAMGHSNWFVENIFQIISKTKKWCDLMTLFVPDGYFLEQFKEALKNICKNNNGIIGKDEPVIIRLMFANIIGMPINCHRLLNKLTEDLPKEANIQIWLGAWRTGASWNHAKLIAVDGRYLHTGGHNLSSDVYLKKDAIHDLSIEMEGNVANDAHLFANEQWKFIENKQDTWLGQILENVPDFVPLVSKNRVIVSEYPVGYAQEFAPYYERSVVPTHNNPSGSVPVISVGRLGQLTDKNRPADDAIVAMIDSSKRIIRMSLQDLGPICIIRGKIPLPGTGWPKEYLNALARAIWQRGVDVEIVLSNDCADPGYTNGWTCNDAASEIIKRIQPQFPNASDAAIRQKVVDNLRICSIRHAKNSKYASGLGIGKHSKFFMTDDICSYTGSQNLYVCDLAEWGVIIDDDVTTKQMMKDYWTPMWEASYVETDCNVQVVMDGLKIDREGEAVDVSTREGRKKMKITARGIARAQLPNVTEMYDEDTKDCSDSDEEDGAEVPHVAETCKEDKRALIY
eukprot:CAMPEP_0194358092 /NCGR_PEP_ID=MMETSP0174-20130528/5432_1 /TAXON_ID=216777 /ORGANISM="Proboscia alata, Strain PI-D3" /LENGTH=529 /DNA_ID=CAMNT_0039128327 /DNA_START=212 /DNA_END=1801 /DNA_ORIENTATION=+